MHLNHKLLNEINKYKIQENDKPPYLIREKTPEETIKKLEKINDFYFKNYGKIFLKIIG